MKKITLLLAFLCFSLLTNAQCASVPSSNDGNGISNVLLGATNFPTTDVTYFDHTGTVVTLGQGITSTVQITFETGYTYDTNIWIDFNDDLTFDAGEQVFDGVSLGDNPTTLDASFVMPAAAALGNHLMRIGTADSGQATPNPCYNGSWGVTLDFTVNIIGISCTPAVVASSVVNADCGNNQFFIDVDVTSVGDATEVTDGTTIWPVTGTGVLQVGPFVSGTTLDLTLTHSDNTCDLGLGNFNFFCPPLNDLCADATVINCGDTAIGNTDQATSNDEPAFCGTGTGAQGVWYSFTSAGNDIVTASLCGSSFDTKIQIYSGTCGALTCVGGNDDNFDECGAGNNSEYQFISTAGTQYYIYVFGFGSSTGAYEFNLSCTPAPDSPLNDECSFATPVSTNPDSSCTNFASGTIFGATTSADADGCDGDFDSNPHDDVWFSFIATASSHLVSLPNSINQDDATPYDNLYIGLYEGTCGSLTNVSCTSGIEALLTDLTIGTTYYIRVYSQADAGLINVTFDVCVGLGSTTEVNANCEDSAPFCANSGALEFQNVSGGTFPDAPQEVVDNTCLGSAPNPAWFFIQVAIAGDMEFEIVQTTEPGGAGTGLDVDYALWGPFSNTDEICTAFTFGDCTGDHNCTGFAIDCSYSADFTENATITNAQAGSFYLFLITNFNGDPGYISLTQTNSTDPGAGATDCTILCPEVTAIDATCGLDNGSIIMDSLEPNTTYTVNYDFNGVAATPVTVTSNGIGDLVISGLAPGDYTGIVTDAPECGTVDRDVTIIDASAPRIDSLVAANDSICVGVDVVFVLTGTPNSTVTYDLNGEADQTIEIGASGVVAVVVTAPTEDVTISLSLISQNGCDGDLTESVTTTVVNLMADLGEDFAFCQSTPQDLTVVTNASASATYVWTLDGAPIVGAITDTITVSTTGNYQVAITDGMCSVNDSVSVSVTSVMTMDLGVDIFTCSNVPTILTADSNIGASGIIYSWTLDGNTISGETSQTLEVTTSGVYEVSGVSGGCNASATINVDITQAFTLGLTDLQICAGENITLDATPIEAVTAPTYLWSTGETSAIINPTLYDTYTVTVTSGACSVTQTIVVTEAVSSFTASISGDTEICEGTTTELTADVVSGVNPTYLWSTGDTTATITVEPATFPITYSVTVTDDSGCSSVFDVQVNEITGCVVPQGISPNNDGINDCFDMSSFEANKITIYNRYGTEVYEMANYRNEWCGTTENGNSGSELPTGTYYYILDLPTGEVMKGWVYINREN